MKYCYNEIKYIKQISDALYNDCFVLVCEYGQYYFTDHSNKIRIDIETHKKNMLIDIKKIK